MIKKVRLNDSILLWLMALPGILILIIFRYVPMFGNIIAFQNYDMFRGIWRSSWVGLFHFNRMFTYIEFSNILKNTLKISAFSILFGFPAPLILALFVNEIKFMNIKRIFQTILYLPHFLSWVIVGGIVRNILAPNGVINWIVSEFGKRPIDFITTPGYFVPILIISGIWKEVGWGMIIYLAALSQINPSLYEASVIDGAGRWKQMLYITLPSLVPSILVLLLFRLSGVLDSNVEQVLIFINPLVRDVGEVIDTYIYRMGLLSAQYSYTTAIGMFKSFIGLSLIFGLNHLSKKTTGDSIF